MLGVLIHFVMLEPIKTYLAKIVDASGIPIMLVFGCLLIITAYSFFKEKKRQSKMDEVPKEYSKALRMKLTTMLLIFLGFVIIIISQT